MSTIKNWSLQEREQNDRINMLDLYSQRKNERIYTYCYVFSYGYLIDRLKKNIGE